MKNYIEELNVSPLNIGKIIEKDGSLFLLVENLMIEKQTKEIVDVIQPFERSSIKVHDVFLISFQNKEECRYSFNLFVNQKIYAICVHIPSYFADMEEKDILFQWDSKMKEMVMVFQKGYFFYKIYNFMVSEYEIFENKNLHDTYYYSEGNYFYRKTGLELNFLEDQEIDFLQENL